MYTQWLKIFLAGDNGWPWKRLNNFNFYRLDSYLALNKNAENTKQITRFKDFILDSGIFTFLIGTKNSDIDWEKYIVDYAKFVRDNKIKNYVQVDIDNFIGLEETEKLTKKLESLVGWQCIPVWHINRGYDKWLEICKDYEYIAFGAFITEALDKDKFIHIKKFLEDAKKEGCKVHGLGFTTFDWLPRLPFYSVDSSSWTAGNRFGHINQFKVDRIVNIKKPEGQRIKDHSALAVHNFNEWIKFSAYAEAYL